MRSEEIRIDAASPEPVYRQIQEQVCRAVAAGRLRPGERLEPVRKLAARLGINPGTAARAYRQLEADGVIVSNRRQGSRVADEDAAASALRAGRLGALMERTLLEGLAGGFSPEEVEAAFGLHLAAWRERRLPAAPVEATVGDAGRVRFAGSHDLALEALWSMVRRSQPEARFDPRYVGSFDGLLALLHGESNLAGCHLLDEDSGEYNLPILRRLFPDRRLRVVALAEREQGLIVASGNPLGVRGPADLARPGVRMVNRPPGTGTRAMLDRLLREAGLAPENVAGYAREAPDHLAVAAAVAEGSADAGPGLRAAAQAFGLGFVPLAAERYDLVLRVEAGTEPPLADLLRLVAGREFRAVVAALPGYSAAVTGREFLL